MNAATLVVTNTNDSGPGSLRYVVAHAPSGSTITFDTSLANKDITITSGQIYINKNLTFIGFPASSRVRFFTNIATRAFYIDANASVTFNNCSFYKCGFNAGTSNGAGGALFNVGNVGILQCDFIDNEVNGEAIVEGAAIYNKGTMQIVKSYIFNNLLFTSKGIAKGGAISNVGNLAIFQTTCMNNVAQTLGDIARGGSIYNVGSLFADQLSGGGDATVASLIGEGGALFNKGTAEVRNSYVSQSSIYASECKGGAFFSTQGFLKVINSTFYSNVSNGYVSSYGGAICLYSGILELMNCTIVDNFMGGATVRGPGVAVIHGLLRIGSTIVALNQSHFEPDGWAPNPINVEDLGYNLIGVIDSFSLSSPTNIYGTLAHPLDPMFVSLGAVSPLEPGSPAIDAGDPNSTLKNDQIGNVRPINNRIDIGAIEYNSYALPTIAITSPAYGSMYQAHSNIDFTTSITDTSGVTITKVEFYHETTKFATDFTAPYTATLSNAPAGIYSVTAKAYVSSGATITSLPDYLTVQTLPIPAIKLSSNTMNRGNDVILYPNPVIDEFTIDNAPKDCKISICDGLGNQLHSTSFTNSVNISSLQPGIYFVTIHSEEANTTKVLKIVKQ